MHENDKLFWNTVCYIDKTLSNHIINGMIHTIFITVLLSVMPISELRGAIPFAVANGISIPTAAILSAACNLLVCPIVFVFLETLHKILIRWQFYKRLIEKFLLRARKKVQGSVEKYGMWGLCLFVAIPLPLTGVWTGTFGGWILNVPRRKIMLASALGVMISATIVSLIVFFGVSQLNFMLKNV